ncbi:MAG: ATP-grasp domain-containing protein [Thermoleophilia bacterium]
MRILAVGLSTRAIAESAFRAGRPLLTLDLFGDLDQRRLGENLSLRRDLGLSWTPQAVLRAAGMIDYEGLVYTSNLENQPRLVTRLAAGRRLLGNPAEVLWAARDWGELRRVCREEAILHPVTLLPGEEVPTKTGERYLVKPVRSGGGRRIRVWRGEPLRPGWLLQKKIPGIAASVSFVADGRRSVVLGLTEQLLGRREFGARGFQWCGNVFPCPLPQPASAGVYAEIRRMANRLTSRLGLQGVNGLDLVLAPFQGRLAPFLIEINPRFSASVELVERALRMSAFTAHERAFARELPEYFPAPGAGAYLAKAVVFARTCVRVPWTEGWLRNGCRDVPHPGEKLEPGQPICTVFAQGSSREECVAGLVSAADWVYADLEPRSELLTEDYVEQAASAHYRSYARAGGRPAQG